MKSPENTENEVNSPAISAVVLKKKECIIETREGEKQNELRETKASVVSRLRGCDNRLLWDANFIFFKPFTPKPQNPYSPYASLYIIFGTNKENYFSNKSFLSWRSSPLLSWSYWMFKQYYSEEKLDSEPS